jgi:predicted  nucleic acid-binding Zn-ribbon protein
MNKKCNNCGKIMPETTAICDKCGSMSFTPIVEEAFVKIETTKEQKKVVEKEINSEVKSEMKEEIKSESSDEIKDEIKTKKGGK